MRTLAILFILTSISLGAHAAVNVPTAAIPAYQTAVLQGIESIGFVCSEVDLSPAVMEIGIRGAQQVIVNQVPNQTSIIFIYKPNLVQMLGSGSEQSIGVILNADGKTIREIKWMAFDPPGPYKGRFGLTQVAPGLIIRDAGSCVPVRKS